MSDPAGQRNVAFVHEWLTEWGGSEDSLRQMLACYPQADLYATIDYLSERNRARLGDRPVRTSWLQRAPLVQRKFWNYLPVTSWAVESHDLSAADIIVSSSHAFAKGVLTHANQLHVSYVYSPMRYAWDLHEEYLRDYGLRSGLKGVLARYMFHRLRNWDRSTASNVDVYVAISHHIRKRIWRCYRRPAAVIYPPVAIQRFALETAKEDHYVTVSRLVSYKRIDLMLRAFALMPQRKLVVIGGGPELERLRAMCPPNVELLGFQEDEVVQQHLRTARAFLFAAHEDFGISPVEAQACGTPVIAYGVGGSVETVRDVRSCERPTGMLFDQQTPESLRDAVEAFDAVSIDPQDCRAWAETFSEERFRAEFGELVERAWDAWRTEPEGVEAALDLRRAGVQ